MRLSPFGDLFDKLHADTGAWLDLHESLQSAHESLPSDSYELTLLVRRGETKQQASDRCLAELFEPRLGSLSEAFRQKFFLHEWPDDLSDVDIHCCRVILRAAMRAVLLMAPLPTDSLAPTILPFPNGPVSLVALWFCSEWWANYGFGDYRRAMRAKQ